MSNKSLVSVLLVSVVALSAPALAAAPGQGTVATDHRVDVQLTDQPGGAEQAAAPDQFEPNDDFNNSTTVEDGTYENLSVSENDIDVYAVSLNETETLTASIQFSHAEGDLEMALVGPDQETIIDGSVSANDSESISAVAPESGTYYLVVYGFQNATAPYSLSVTTASGVGGENATTSETGTETANNTTETANNTTAAGNVRPPVVD